MARAPTTLHGDPSPRCARQRGGCGQRQSGAFEPLAAPGEAAVASAGALRRGLVVGLLCCLGACDSESGEPQRDTAGAAHGGAATAGAGQGGLSGGAPRQAEGGSGFQLPVRTCGTASCDSGATCCAAAGTCGYLAPSEAFRETCLDATPRGGQRATDCPASPEYCRGDVCQSFEGCRAADGLCGYWVDGFFAWAGETRIETSAELGCLGREEFVDP